MMDTFDPHDTPIFSDRESPGYYPASTPPQNHKGRPRKRKPAVEDASCPDIPVGMRMAAATLGKFGKNFLINRNSGSFFLLRRTVTISGEFELARCFNTAHLLRVGDHYRR